MTDHDTMRAITLWRPWSDVVRWGIKPIENRPWEPPTWLLGKRIAIHAGQRWDLDSYLTIRKLAPNISVPGEGSERSPTGIVATTELIAVVTSAKDAERLAGHGKGRWFVGPYGWVFRDTRALDIPIPCRGYQKLWKVPPDVLAQIPEAFR